MKNTRERNYDLLRVLAMIAVITTHVSGTWFEGMWGFAVAGMDMADLQHPFMAALYYCLARFAVPCFVMLSGAFTLCNPANADYRSFYRKIFRKVGIPTLIASVIYILYSIPSLLWGETRGLYGLKVLLQNILKGAPYPHLWYLYMMIGVYALTPIVIRFRQSVTVKTYQRVAVIFLILASISAYTTSGRQLNWDLGLSFEYLGYFMIGDVIRANVSAPASAGNRKGTGKAGRLAAGVLLILGALVIEGITAWYVYRINYLEIVNPYVMQIQILAELSPAVVLPSVMLFAGFAVLPLAGRQGTASEISEDAGVTKNAEATEKLKTSEVPAARGGILHYLAQRSFYIYLIHAGVYDVIRKCFRLKTGLRMYMYRYLDGMIWIPGLVIVVLVISLLIANVLTFMKFQRKSM